MGTPSSHPFQQDFPYQKRSICGVAPIYGTPHMLMVAMHCVSMQNLTWSWWHCSSCIVVAAARLPMCMPRNLDLYECFYRCV